jgi:hypothetical protein
MISLGLAAGLLATACTTTEGTNAFVDFETFEREAMIAPLQGFGLVDKPPPKEETNQRRAPLVLPKDGSALPAPREEVQVASLPEDSDKVRIDATGLTEEDIKRLRNARVVDLRTLSGRPLTDEEARQLTSRMTAAQLPGTKRPLYLPPAEYFTTVEGTDLVCLAADGQLVRLDDKRCPEEIRTALADIRAAVRSSNGGTSSGLLSESAQDMVKQMN